MNLLMIIKSVLQNINRLNIYFQFNFILTMVAWLVIGLITILILFLAYIMILKPKSELKLYQKLYSEKNYKVLNLNFVPFSTSLQQQFDSGYKNHLDCHYQLKNTWSKYDVILCNFIQRPLIQFVNPQLGKQFYELQNQKNFQKYSALTVHLERMVGKSITFSEGLPWKNKRKVMTQFLNFSFIKSVSEKIHSICKRQTKIFFQKHKLEGEKKEGKEVSQIFIQELIEMINSTVVAELFFGGGNQRVDSIQIDGKALPHFMRDLMEQTYWQTLNPLSNILGVRFVELGIRKMDRRVNRMLKLFRQFASNFVHNRIYQIQEQIKSKGEIKQAKDLIEAFYLSKGVEQINSNKKQFIQNLINDFANLYTAGTDTTEHATMMMIYLIDKHPNVKQKLLQQIQNSKLNIESLTYDSIKNLSYLEAIVYESLRVYQTANGIFPRQVLKNVSIGGVQIKKGTVVATQTLPTHYKTQLYQNPSQFIPERWLDSQKKVKSPQPFCFNTFSNGIRSCIGKQLALQEMKLFSVYFLSKYDTQFQTLDLKFNYHGFAYEPQPIKMKFWEKSQ